VNIIFYIFLIALCTTLTSYAENPGESVRLKITSNSNASIGQKWIGELVKAYTEGKFASRLAAIDAEIEKGIDFDKFETPKEFLDTSEAKKEREETIARLEPYRQKSFQLNEEYKEALAKVSRAYPTSEIVKSIKVYNEFDCCSCNLEKYSVLTKVEDILDNKQNALHPLFNEIASKYELRTYAIMLLRTDFEMIEGAAIGFHTESFAKRHEIDTFLIRFEQFLEALKIAQAQADESLIVLITQAINEYIESRGSMHDVIYLSLFGNRSVSPQDEAEKQVATIMSDFRDKLKALIQEYFPMPARS
jgi:hypothetical protein